MFAICAAVLRHQQLSQPTLAPGLPNDFPSADVAAGLLGMLLQHPSFYGIVAERDGTIIGSNFLDERSAIAGLGPITVDPVPGRRPPSDTGPDRSRGLPERTRRASVPGRLPSPLAVSLHDHGLPHARAALGHERPAAQAAHSRVSCPCG